MTRCRCSASHIRWPNTTVRYNLHVLPPSTTKSTFISMYSLMTVSKNSMREHSVPLCTMWDISPPIFSCEVDGFHLPEVPLPGACGRFFLQALAAANTKQVKIFVLGMDFNDVSLAKTQMGLDLSRHLFYSTDFWKWFLVWCLMFFKLYFIMPWKVIYGCDFERDHNLTFCPFFFTRNFRTISMYL